MDADPGSPPSSDLNTGTPRQEGATLGVKIFMAIVIIGMGAAAYGGLKTYLDKRAQSAALDERGVETDASVTSVTEISGRRIETYHKITVSFDPPGSTLVELAEVQDCSGHRYEGADTMRVVYLPDDTDVIRLEACRSSFDANVFPGIIGLLFGALTIFLIWRTRGMWTS